MPCTEATVDSLFVETLVLGIILVGRKNVEGIGNLTVTVSCDTLF
jgi:hypothetical protein